jgi:hypothetical protein
MISVESRQIHHNKQIFKHLDEKRKRGKHKKSSLQAEGPRFEPVCSHLKIKGLGR